MLNVEENISLARHTSLHVGGPAAFFIHVKTDEEILEALQFAQQKKMPFFILGKGSNTLFSDEGFKGVIIHMEDRRISHKGMVLTAASGVFMRPFVNYALDNSLRGLEELAGIPGTVGGAIRGNAGTWSTDIQKVLHHADVLVPDGSSWKVVQMSNDECLFGYRTSIFKKHIDWIILRGHFALQLGDAQEGQKIVAKDHADRHAKQPYDAASAGSIFKNPDKENKIFSGALIEKAGLKGFTIGGAEISTKHANFILNRQKATSADIMAVIKKAQEEVKKQSSIDLEPEIVIVP